ncbi:hypothetical protein LWI28_021420 [Acer negundo]|uniref:Uncharacterized protein n=1 Tax=Acer negundo TaxID=4023 RepID=A0AAD5JUK4_ACENE|nr:hypothetical protein LWI28_021420 [Acer negundo]
MISSSPEAIHLRFKASFLSSILPLLLRDLGPLNFFLGIQVSTLPNGGHHPSQGKYIEDLLDKAKMLNARPISTLMITSTPLPAKVGDPFEKSSLYRTKSETKQLKEDAEKMTKEKGQICSQILEKQRKIASLESDSSTLTQTLDLMQQERVSLSAKLVEKSTFYAKAVEETSSKLQQHKENDARKTLMAKLDSAKAKLDGFAQMKSKLVMENSQAELLAMDVTTLEEEHKALLSDKAGETEYMLSLQDQIEKLKGISHVINCACGKEYKV